MVNNASYNRKQQTLYISVNNKTYTHYNVPKYMFNDLVSSPSREEFYEQNIKNVFPLENTE